MTFSHYLLVYLLIPFAALLGGLAVKFLDRLRGRDAEAEAKGILDQAQLEIANRKKEAELEIKESMLREKERLEVEQKAVRDQLDELERQLKRQQEANEQRAEQLTKQERAVEGTQRRLSERLEQPDLQGQRKLRHTWRYDAAGNVISGELWHDDRQIHQVEFLYEEMTMLLKARLTKDMATGQINVVRYHTTLR